MHKLAENDPVASLTPRICKNEHLEELFLEYLRISASMSHLKRVRLSQQHRTSLELLKQIALDAFLVEANRSFPIQKLNGQIPELISGVSKTLSKKFNLEAYFG